MNNKISDLLEDMDYELTRARDDAEVLMVRCGLLLDRIHCMQYEQKEKEKSIEVLEAVLETLESLKENEK
jgi:hypothetical protein